MQEQLISDFFKNDLPAYGSYDNTRKLPGIDGLKISQRKLVWTGLKKAKDFVKTDTLANITTVDTAYVHGSGNLCGVMDSLVQNFIGACNFPFFTGNSGGWGCRLIPRSAAPRYTRAKISDLSKALFLQSDNEILEQQYFEGQYIEPKCLVPIFPTIFLNNSEGLSTGFRSKIFARNPREIIRWIRAKLQGKGFNGQLLPWARGFKGEVKVDSEGQAECWGKIEKKHSTKYVITELPFETDYQKYVELLDKLVDNGTIVDYVDKCDPKTDAIYFEIKTTREFSNRMDKAGERKLYDELGLIQSLKEHLNCIGEDGKVKEYSSVTEILDDYYNMRYSFYEKRKAHIMSELKREISILVSKFMFCSSIIKGELVISKRAKSDIEADLDKMANVVKVDDSYNYLLRLPMSSITKEELMALREEILSKRDQYVKLDKQTAADLWMEDLTTLEKNYFKGL